LAKLNIISENIIKNHGHIPKQIKGLKIVYITFIKGGHNEKDHFDLSDVNEIYEPYLIPQDYGLRADDRWIRLTDSNVLELSSAAAGCLISMLTHILLKNFPDQFILTSLRNLTASHSISIIPQAP